MRAGGGLCIADEVQVGLGRVGSHWWAFEREGAVPDIVTLGKPLGNGHPMAAVVTTRAIAEAFANGMEYFNTFGGNPVSCAVGNAVLDVIDDEHAAGARRQDGCLASRRLQRARTPGTKSSATFAESGSSSEWSWSRIARAKAPAAAAAITWPSARAELGVLLSVDGLLHNVLKFKPPMVFGEAERARLVEVLDQVLAEDGARPNTIAG